MFIAFLLYPLLVINKYKKWLKDLTSWAEVNSSCFFILYSKLDRETPLITDPPTTRSTT